MFFTVDKNKLSLVVKCLFISLLCTPFQNLSYAASAPCGCVPGGCSTGDCNSARNDLVQHHDDLEQHTKDEFDDDLEAFEEWLIEEFLNKLVIPAMADMTTQMNATAMLYTQIIGSFLDAKTQMETQRVFQKLKFDAHKDYIPSEDFCWFGTNVRSLAATESRANAGSLAHSQMSLQRQLGVNGLSSSNGQGADLRSRWEYFVYNYCDKRDNGYVTDATSAGRDGSGLEFACDHDGPGGSSDVGATDANRVNIDLDYTRLIDEPRTLDINLNNGTVDSSQELDALSLGKNLYGHRVLSNSASRLDAGNSSGQSVILAIRSIAAKRSVAEHSYNAILNLKASGSSEDRSVAEASYKTSRYMGAIMRELMSAGSSGLGEAIYDLIGENPSYYAQLEILAKRIYQIPDFYANLYDTPANVKRKKVAMKAIELMLDRAIYESQLRREMTVSVLLSSKLRPAHREANKGLQSGK